MMSCVTPLHHILGVHLQEAIDIVPRINLLEPQGERS